ncbi:MAG: hypothetical protein WA324_19125 [Bryobacteraceae bacterium]
MRHIEVDRAINRAPALSIAEDKDDLLLISFQGRGLWRYRDGWKPVKAPGLPTKAPWAIFRDSREQLWLGYPNKQVFVRKGSTYQLVNLGEGRWSNTLTFYEAAGTIWAGSSDGLCFLAKERLLRVHATEAGLLRGISGIARDRSGSLWLNAADGAIRIDAAEVGRLLKDPNYPVSLELFSDKDGLMGQPTHFKPTPSAVVDAHGILRRNIRLHFRKPRREPFPDGSQRAATFRA